jgi:hypothetical protein
LSTFPSTIPGPPTALPWRPGRAGTSTPASGSADPISAFGIGFGIGFYGGFEWGWPHWGFDWHNRGAMYNHHRYHSQSSTFYNRNNFYRGSGDRPWRNRRQPGGSVQAATQGTGLLGNSGGRSAVAEPSQRTRPDVQRNRPNSSRGGPESRAGAVSARVPSAATSMADRPGASPSRGSGSLGGGAPRGGAPGGGGHHRWRLPAASLPSSLSSHMERSHMPQLKRIPEVPHGLL